MSTTISHGEEQKACTDGCGSPTYDEVRRMWCFAVVLPSTPFTWALGTIHKMPTVKCAMHMHGAMKGAYKQPTTTGGQ